MRNRLQVIIKEENERRAWKMHTLKGMGGEKDVKTGQSGKLHYRVAPHHPGIVYASIGLAATIYCT